MMLTVVWELTKFIHIFVVNSCLCAVLCHISQGNSKSCDSNVILYPGIDGRSSSGWNRQCQTNDDAGFRNEFHHSK